ncbi:MAG: hypothetical protein ACK55I_00260, partial [bacterium]
MAAFQLRIAIVAACKQAVMQRDAITLRAGEPALAVRRRGIGDEAPLKGHILHAAPGVHAFIRGPV